jgi:hypothetical protein
MTHWLDLGPFLKASQGVTRRHKASQGVTRRHKASQGSNNGRIRWVSSPVKACNLQDNTCAQSLSVLKGRCLTNSRFYFALWMGLSGGSIFKLSSIALAQILKARPR